MKPTRKLSRRSFLASVSGAAVGGGALLGMAGEARAFQVTDRDPGDPVGRGRGGTGITDRDPSDPPGRGRGGTRSGITDRDPTDPSGNGRGGNRTTSGITDRDPTDPSGNGRGGNRTTSGVTDRDPGDPVGNGRGTRVAQVRGACTQCSCTEYVQPTTGHACARSTCGHHYNRHADPNCRPGNQC